MPKHWDDDATYGSDILGTGQAWGDMRGKVKTKQIGFIRQKPDGRVKNNGTGKVQNNQKGRSKRTA